MCPVSSSRNDHGRGGEPVKQTPQPWRFTSSCTASHYVCGLCDPAYACLISSMERSVFQAGFGNSHLRAGGGFKLAGKTTPRAMLPAQLPSLPARQPHLTAVTESRFICELMARVHALESNGSAAGVSRSTASPAAFAPKVHRVDIDLSSVTLSTPRRAQGLHIQHMSDRDALGETAGSGGNDLPRSLCKSGTASVSQMRSVRVAERSPRPGTMVPPGMTALAIVSAITPSLPHPKPADQAGTATPSINEAAHRRPIFGRSVFEPPHTDPSVRVYVAGPPRGLPFNSSGLTQVAASPVPFPSRRHARHLAEVGKPAGQIGLSRPEPVPPIGRDVSAYAHVSTRCVILSPARL